MQHKPKPAHQQPRRSLIRNSDSALEMPTVARVLRLVGRTIRLRCPHCGEGAVLSWKGSVRANCSGCGLRFKRSDDHYFFGAVFFGLLMGEAMTHITHDNGLIAGFSASCHDNVLVSESSIERSLMR